MEIKRRRAVAWAVYVVGSLVAGGLLLTSMPWSRILAAHSTTPSAPASSAGTAGLRLQPFESVVKLSTAALLGALVTLVHRRRRGSRPGSRTLAEAQVLLAVAGAVMMLVIEDSLARAFGIAGAASIIRFRTQIKDPKEAILLFLLLGVGMACGLGAYSTAALAAVFLCVLLILLDRYSDPAVRLMTLELTSAGGKFPSAHVQEVLARNGVEFEPREMVQGKESVAKYHAAVDTTALSLEALSAQLLADGSAGLKTVAWETEKGNG